MEAAMNLMLPDIPRIYTALAEWMACILCIMEVKRRVKGWKFVGISLGALLWQAFFLQITENVEGIFWIVCMVLAVAFMYLFIVLCCEINWKDAGYYCVRAFATAEFAASLEWQMDCFGVVIFGWDCPWFRMGLLVLHILIVQNGLHTFQFMADTQVHSLHMKGI